ncbi:hypothetical protein LJC68_06910 [Bacteroidales bacterium OttesenSCG-928-B11]|nr:hypothetical protein [Bacteroidales bacterium OttesenSCG-928-E04]MDL2308195.1 hypothetical protein [Bacteroidales bacterium OttesenSCG-928-C03]MDL2312591.1 hypothetical protein [Bacteroidales bacterium OttesenSCG-928-B11]MDL2325633.1 hypothetical protein [Bacteroidales bacterium OttesenSCG-928-A14]
MRKNHFNLVPNFIFFSDKQRKRVTKTNHTLLLAVLFILAGSFFACEKDDYPIVQNGRVDISKKEYILMRVSPEKVAVNSSGKLIIENHTKEDMEYDLDYSLEYSDNGNWTQVPFRNEWVPDCMLRYVGAGKSEEMLLFYRGEEPSQTGKYRITKKIGGYILSLEFEVL